MRNYVGAGRRANFTTITGERAEIRGWIELLARVAGTF